MVYVLMLLTQLFPETNVARDYVEFPSQLLERWLPTATVLQKYAIHYKTGQALPKSLIEKLDNASKFNQGFETTEYLSSALVDMKLHLAGDKVTDPDQFEKENLSSTEYAIRKL
jgi:peptidyl-dipeptidase Dcp